MARKESKAIKIEELLGKIGFWTLVIIAIYLLLKRIGLFQSPRFEDILTGVVVAQVFYNGYAHRALKEIDRKLEKIERKLGI